MRVTSGKCNRRLTSQSSYSMSFRPAAGSTFCRRIQAWAWTGREVPRSALVSLKGQFCYVLIIFLFKVHLRGLKAGILVRKVLLRGPPRYSSGAEGGRSFAGHPLVAGKMRQDFPGRLPLLAFTQDGRNCLLKRGGKG